MNPSVVKTVPFAQISAYYDQLNDDKKTLDQLMDLKARGVLNEKEIADKATPQLEGMHTKITKVLKDNKIIALSSNEEIQEHVENIAKQVLRIQNKLFSQKQQKQVDVKEIIQSMQSEIQNSFGEQLSQQLVEKLTGVFEENFDSFKQVITQVEENLTNVIRRQQRDDIDKLKDQLDDKEKKIHEKEKKIQEKENEIQQKDQTIKNLIAHLDRAGCKGADVLEPKVSTLEQKTEEYIQIVKEETGSQILNITTNASEQLNEQQTQPQIVEEESKSESNYVSATSSSDEILHLSYCTDSLEEKAFLNEIMGDKKFRTRNVYRGSRDGWSRQDFHRMSDEKGPTLSLFKLQENGVCIGGFTSAQWSTPLKDTRVSDSTAMLFNLTTRNFFKCQQERQAISCWNGCGPCFGDGELEGGDSFNEYQNCKSIVNGDVYCIQIDNEGRNKLTNLPSKKGQNGKCFFAVSEIEVWEVIYLE